MIGMKMRDEHRPDVVKPDIGAFQRNERRRAAVDQKIRLLAAHMKTGVEVAPLPKASPRPTN